MQLEQLTEDQLDYGVDYVTAMANERGLPENPLDSIQEDQLWSAVANRLAELRHTKTQERFHRQLVIEYTPEMRDAARQAGYEGREGQWALDVLKVQAELIVCGRNAHKTLLLNGDKTESPKKGKVHILEAGVSFCGLELNLNWPEEDTWLGWHPVHPPTRKRMEGRGTTCEECITEADRRGHE